MEECYSTRRIFNLWCLLGFHRYDLNRFSICLNCYKQYDVNDKTRINFERWNNYADDKWIKCRLYFKGYIWTPFVTLKRRHK